MHHNSATADLAPPRFPRQVILGAAFLIGLAAALAPRTPAVHAQEPNAPPAATAPAPKSQSASKTITITGGGSGAKIEVKDARDPTAKGSAISSDAPDDEDAAGAAGKPDTGKHSVTIGKHGRIQVDGLGVDREFDSVGDFVHNEPEIAGMVVAIVTVVFLSPVLVIALILWYRMRKARMLNETMLTLAEKGIVTPSDALEALAGGKQEAMLQTAAAAAPIYEQAKQIRRRAAWSDLRKGVLTGGVGLALMFYSMLDEGAPNGLGLVLFFVGAGFIVLWWFEERQLAPAKGIPAGTGPSIGASGTPPGGPPPSA
ncbi:MAG: DUF6249 domain-containing protein [Betaproteobacteria bacterium]